MDDDPERLQAIARAQPPFGELMGIRIVSASRDRVEAEFDVVPELGNRNGVLHGSAVMGIADNIGGTASFLNLQEGEGATTIESKTNFFRSVAMGETVSAVCVPLHKGRSTTVWQTTLTRADGKVAAIVTQTQMILREKN